MESLLAMVLACFAQDFKLESAGARFGFNPIGAGHDFYQAEAFVDWNLPWAWDLGSSWDLQSRLDVSAGWIGESGAQAAIASAGPTFVVAKRNLPVSFEAGISPTLMSRSKFDSKDFGIPFQFISHIGLNLEVSSRIRLGYRFQHMSNADLSPHNPGLNLNMIGLSFLF